VPRVLHIEDDVDLGRVIKAALAGRAELLTVGTLRAAEELLRAAPFSLVILDILLPDGDGLSLLEALILGPTPVLILSAIEVSREIRRRVAVALVKSRVSEEHIVATILSLLPQTVPQVAAAARL
jgi:DNA-binding response OmpR family regulator